MHQTISFGSIDVDDEGNPIKRCGVILAVTDGKIKLLRTKGPPKYGDEESKDNDANVLGPNEEVWCWTQLHTIEEIITPPPTVIENNSIKWTTEKKDL